MSMRPADLAAAATRTGGTTITSDPGASAPAAGPLDTVVVVLDVAGDVAPVAASLDAAADGARLLVLLPCRTSQLPVGRLVDVLSRHGGQAVAVLPVDDRTHPTAVVVERGEAQPSLAWLPTRGLVELDLDQQRRLRAELVVGGAAEHATGLVDGAAAVEARRRAESAEARAAAAEADVVRLTAEATALRTSRSYEVGQAFAEVRSAPVSGIVHLPGRLRRAGKGSAGR
jgi:hypothetical protein